MPDATTLGKGIILLGLGLTVVGGLVWLAGRAGFPLGRLPGDLNFQSGNVGVYFPCASTILISIGLTILANLALRLMRH